MVLVWLLIALAAIPLTLRLYNRFQSEWAQQWGRQSAFSQLMKVLAGFLVSFVLCMTLFSMLFDNILPNSIAAALVGGPIGFLVVEGITGKGFQNLRRSGKYILATVALCLSCTLFLATGGFGCAPTPRAERYTPPASVTGSRPGGTAATSSVFSGRSICPTGPERA